MYSGSQEDLETHFQTNFTSTPVEFENAPLDISNISEYVRHAVRFGSGKVTSLSGACFRYQGAVIVQIFVKPGIGLARPMELADTISGLYRAAVIGGHMFGVPEVTKHPAGGSGWVQVQVYCPFYFEEYA